MCACKAEVERRLVSKDGHSNVRLDNVEGMVQMYLHDIWTTVVDMKWRYKLTLFTSTFVTTWFAFGVVFYLICLGHGDLAAAATAAGGGAPSNHTPCVANVETLTAAFLFSLESQTTIGYGFRCISEECPLAIFALVAQLLLTGLAEIFVTGAFLAKLARPKKRSETVRFGHFAVVRRDRGGALQLVVRVANMRKSLLIQCRLTGTLLRPSSTAEGETTLVRQSRVDFRADSSSSGDGGGCPFLVLPLAFYHELDDPGSPLAGLTAESLRAGGFELLVTLNATVESTAAACQSRASYVPREILWGYDFAPVIYGAAGGRYVADFRFFDQVHVQSGVACCPGDGTEKQRLEEEYKRE